MCGDGLCPLMRPRAKHFECVMRRSGRRRVGGAPLPEDVHILAPLNTHGAVRLCLCECIELNVDEFCSIRIHFGKLLLTPRKHHIRQVLLLLLLLILQELLINNIIFMSWFFKAGSNQDLNCPRKVFLGVMWITSFDFTPKFITI